MQTGKILLLVALAAAVLMRSGSVEGGNEVNTSFVGPGRARIHPRTFGCLLSKPAVSPILVLVPEAGIMSLHKGVRDGEGEKPR